MKIATLLLALLPAGSAAASHFEFCDMRAQVLSIAAEAAPRRYALSVQVTGAARARENGQLSYSDCRDYIGQPLDLSLRIAAGVPEVGEQIRFSRSVVDTFGANGEFAGSEVNVQLQSVHNADPSRVRPQLPASPR